MQNGKSNHCADVIECPFEPAMGILKSERQERVDVDAKHAGVLEEHGRLLEKITSRVEAIDKRTQNLKWILSVVVAAASMAGQILSAIGK